MHRPVLAAGAVALSMLIAGPAAAAPVAIDLRVEGARGTIFEKRVTTDGHVVRTASGGAHRCDGTNGGVNPTPGPTGTAALDDGARLGGFSWDGTWSDSFDDYLISRVGPDRANDSQFWALLVNSQFSQVGGCQQRVAQGDEVLWAFDGFSKQHVLRLSGPGAANTGRPVTVRVTDGQNGAPIGGARVGGAISRPDGRAVVGYNRPGLYRLKAERSDSIRSNTLVLCVDPVGAPACSSGDKVAPGLTLSLPGALASDRGRSRTILVSWQGDDGSGSGVTSYDAEVQEVAAGARNRARPWRTLVRRTDVPRRHFRGRSGRTYRFRITAVDRAGNRRTVVSDRVVLPVDDRDRRTLRFSRGWRRLKRSGAWGRTVVRSRRRGASARMRFRGRRLVLIGRKLPKGGRLRVTIDGRSRVVRLRGKARHRRLLYRSRRLSGRRHTLRLRALGGGPVEVDAVAPIP